jgi:TolB-like protein
MRSRRIPETVAAFIGGGWFLVEFVHWALIDHYRLPEALFDLALISVLCALLCTVTWRWFRSADRKRTGFRYEWILLTTYVTVALFLNGRIVLHMLQGGENAEYTPAWSNSVAVLAFSDLSPGKDQEYFCEGVAEDIRTKLTRFAPTLKVISRYSVIPCRNTRKPVQQIGRELGVATLLEGTVQKEDRRMRIHAQLINTSDGSHLWAGEYDREARSLFDIQDEISLSIADVLKVRLGPGTREAIREDRLQNMESYRLYKKANDIINNDYAKSQSEADFNRAIGLYHEALAVDSGSALLHASLAWA